MADAISFPGLLTAAEEESAQRQTIFFVLTGLQLGLLAAAAATALIPVGWAGNSGPIVTLLLFVVAVALQVSGLAPKAERRWYDARAAAESIKSSSWEYAVGGEAFRAGDPDAESRFIGVLRRVLEGLPHLDIGATDVGNASVTGTMRALRESSRENRKFMYVSGRVQDQVAWYSAKAKWNKRRSHWFTGAAVAVEIAAVAFGLVRVAGELDVDFLGALAATAVAIVGWMQAKKYASLSEAYSVTSHEVALVAATLDEDQDEEVWAQSVHDAEAAFSREHTMWQARRQGPV